MQRLRYDIYIFISLIKLKHENKNGNLKHLSLSS